MTIYLIKYDLSSMIFLSCTWFGETYRLKKRNLHSVGHNFVQNHSVKLILVSFDLQLARMSFRMSYYLFIRIFDPKIFKFRGSVTWPYEVW